MTSFCPSFSHHSLISVSSCVVRAKSEAAGPLEAQKSHSDLCCFLLHSVGQSKSQGQHSGSRGKQTPPSDGKSLQGHCEGTSRAGGVVAGFFGNNPPVHPCQNNLCLNSQGTNLKYPLLPVSAVGIEKSRQKLTEMKVTRSL